MHASAEERCPACGVGPTSTVDKLTGLSDRWAWDDAARRLLSACQESGKPVTLLLADLDRFKDLNDRFGHPAGDTVLVEVANTLRRVVGTDGEALLGRYGGCGGDEFLVLLPETDEATGRRIAEQCRLQLRSVAVRLPTTSGEHAVLSGISASMGVTAADPDAQLDLDDLILCADAGMQAAKRCGRDHVCTAPAVAHHSRRSAPATLAPRPGADGAHHPEAEPEVLDRDSCLRHLLDVAHVLSGQWTPDVLLALATGPRRHCELLCSIRQARVVDGWSGRDRQIQPGVLNRTLRRLECDGMVRRTVEPGTWPRAVRYELSTVAQDLLTATVPAVLWSRQHASALSRARPARAAPGNDHGTPISPLFP